MDSSVRKAIWGGPSPFPRELHRQRAVDRLEKLARLLDVAYKVPGTDIRFGLDALIGVLPVAGDLASAAFSAYLIYEARRLGLPRRAIAMMIANVAFDTALGSVPLVGDICDIFWRSNIRNMKILRRHIG